MSDQQSGTKTVGRSTTEEQQQQEDSIVPPIVADPTGTDKGDGTKSPTIVEKDKTKGVTPVTPNISSVDDAAKRSENRPTLTLNPDGQGSKSIVPNASQAENATAINLVDGNEDDAPMDSPVERMDATIARLTANHEELTTSLINDTSGDKTGQESPSIGSQAKTI